MKKNAKEDALSELSWKILMSLALDQRGTLAAILSALSYYTKGERVEIKIGDDEWASIEVPENVREQIKLNFKPTNVN